MSYKPEESTLIAYLYDELEGADKKKVEEYLFGDEAAQKELEELKDTLSILGHLKDKEVEIPTFTFENASQVVAGGKSEISFWRRSLAIAASIALVMLVGYATEFKVALNEGFQLSFGVSTTGYNQQEVESMIASAIEKNNNELDQRIDNTEASLKQFVDDKNQSFQNRLVSQVSQSSEHGNQTSFDKQQFLTMFKELLEESELAQKKYTDEAMTDFAIFLDIQRQNDLEIIQTRFNNLQDDAEINQLQTNQILANIISTVDQPSLNQY
jgi:hypothetical protein